MRRILSLICFAAMASGAALASCTSPQNAIVAENCNPGTTEWQVDGVGDLTIQGFATDISVNVGQTVYFKINTPATNYHVDIYRLGYYGGTGGRYITTIQPSATLPQSQPACLTDPTTLLYDCGNWGISASWTVPANAVSGIYIAAPVRGDTGGASQIVFVVRNDASHSAVLFQTADETWQAYNGYGGNSLYGPTDLFALTNRALKVSYNRPYDTRVFDYEAVTFVFGAEYPMVRWLEANGYDVTYFTGLDAARSGALIRNHNLFLSVGHDEYWSGPQRTNVEAARDAGVNMAFFSGNEVFWKTRWENSIDGTNTPYRTLVCYKETLGPNSIPQATAAVDPLDPPTWTGTWRDPSKSPPADGGRPENSLTGTIFTVNGTSPDNPGNLSIQVPAADGKMRFWRNTSVANLASGQTATLPAGSLGYEWDEDLDNGARPAGTFDLSTATYTLTTDLLLDQGGVYGAGTAIHHMTMHRAPSGALVFGAGTIQWSWGLDSTHDNPYPFPSPAADPDMQQAVVNLFADMGVQPATLQPGLLVAMQSADTVPPVSQIASPTSGSAVRVGTIVNISGTALDTGGGVVGGVEVSVDGGATWHPATGRESWSYPWTPSASGFYTIQSRATDDSANLETPSPGVTVAASTTAQTLVSLTLNSSTVTGGNTLQGTVTLGQAAAAGGIVVTLSSNNPTVASVPSSVTVAAGQFSANFTVTTFAVPLPASATISGTYVAISSASLTVTATLPPPPGSVGIDALIAHDQGTAATTVNSGVFSTSLANELILAFVGTDALTANTTVTGMTGAGLTWNLVVRTNTQLGTSEIWRAFAVNPLTNVSVTANLSQNVVSSMLVMSFAGVDPSGTNGSGAIGATGSANAASGAPSATLTTTRNNSVVLGIGNDWDNPTARVLGTNQTMLHQYLASSGDTYWMQMHSVPVPSAGTAVTINDTSPTTDRYNLSIVEVRPPSTATLSISGTVSPSASGSGTTLTLAGTENSTTTADVSGNYAFTGLTNGSYTVTPTKTGVVFSPTSQAVTLSGTSMTAVNFTAAVLTSIAIIPVNPTIQAGNTQPFTATGTYSDNSTQNISTQVTWSSSETSVATIISSGLATTIAGGSTIITAKQGSVSGSTTLTVQPTTLVIGATTLPSGTQNQAYSATLVASGGTAPYSWSLANNTTLPPGLNLSSAGQITGTPTVAGTTVFTVQVADAGTPQQTVTQQLTLVVAPPPSYSTIWSPSSVPGTIDVGGGGTCSSCALVQATNSASSGTSDPTSYVNPTTTGDLLIVFGVHSGWTGSGTSTISDSAGNTWHPCSGTGAGAFTDIQANGTYGMSCHYAVNIIGASVDTVIISASDCKGGCSFVGGSYLEYSGVAPTAAAAWNAYGFHTGGTSTTGSNNTTCGSVTTTQNNDLVICGMDQANGNISAGTSPINFGSLDQPGTIAAVEHAVWPSSGAINPTMTDSESGDAYTGITVALNPNSTVSAAELGLKFKSDVNGTITGVRFYKSSNNTGTHVGNLWSSSGTLLASATFTNETASGWQQVTFSPAVTIAANTVYVASYHTNVGHYSEDQNYFATSGVDTPPLHALQNGVSGSNGVSANGSSSSFPSNGFNSSNYWVDVVFVPSATLTSIAVTPANPTIQAGNTQPFTATGTYSDNSTQNISSQVTWLSSKTSVATVNSSGLATTIAAGSTIITATQGSVSGNTTLTVQPATLVVTTTSLPSGTLGQAYTASLAASGGTPPFGWTLINNTALPPGLALSSGGQITGTPTATGTSTFTVQITDSGTPAQTATQTLSITVAASGCPCSIAGTITGSGGNAATVTLTGGTSVTANASGNYIANGLANGTYIVTPSKAGYVFTPNSQSVLVSGTSVTGVNFSSTAQLGIDQTVSTDRSSKATTIASPTFSTTKPNELLLAFVATDATAANMTVTGVTGASLTWTLVKRTNTQLGTAEIWRAFSSTTLSSVSVTATLAKSVAASLAVVTFTGVDPSGTGGSGAIGNTGTGNANPGAPTAQLTTTRNNSWVFGVGNDYDNAIARTVGPSQTIVHQYLATGGDTYWVQRQNSTTPTSGTVVTINDTAPTTDRYNLSTCEILPAP